MPTFEPIIAKPLKESLLSIEKISAKTMTEHYKLYEGYVKKTNEIREKLQSVDLATANQTYSDIRELKVELSFALGGVKNHEIYFDILGGTGGDPTGKIKDIIQKEWGNYDNWKKDVKATGVSARGWVWMAYDWQDKKFFNYLGDAQNTFPIWNATPIIALDTYEHAYWMDFGSDRGSYIDIFFSALDWDIVNKRLENAQII